MSGSRKNSYKSDNCPAFLQNGAERPIARTNIIFYNDKIRLGIKSNPCIRPMTGIAGGCNCLTPFKKYLYSHQNEIDLMNFVQETHRWRKNLAQKCK
jgi:hypothetical protein